MAAKYAWASAMVLVLTLLFSGCAQKKNEDPRLAGVNERLAKLERVPMSFDARLFPPEKKRMLKALVDATKLIHEAFLRQMYPPGVALRDSLKGRDDEFSQKLLRLVIRNGGPFDKMDGYTSFYGSGKRPPGAAVYPSDLTRQEFESYLTNHQGEAKALSSPYTVVRREGSQLKAIPYHEEYEQWIRPAADLIHMASTLTDNPSLKKYLASRAEALLTDNYYQADVDWIDLAGSDIDFYIAPYEVYEDQLVGIKAFYEGTVGVIDKEESQRLTVYTSHLEELERNLPYDSKFKRPVKGLVSKMVVLDELIRGGDVATGYQAVATNLPNDPKVQTTKGTKKIFWKNMMNARVTKVIEPIGRALLASDQIRYITEEASFNVVLMHELCHALGPHYVYATNDTVPVNRRLKELTPPIEEGKATVAGLHSIKYLIDKGIIPKKMEKEHYVSYLAGLFRTIRFGTTEPHSRASMCELTFLRDRGGIRLDPVTRKWSIDFDRVGPAISDLARIWLTIEATGDYEGAKDFLKKWSFMPKEVEDALKDLDYIPVDVEPVYSIRWE